MELLDLLKFLLGALVALGAPKLLARGADIWRGSVEHDQDIEDKHVSAKLEQAAYERQRSAYREDMAFELLELFPNKKG